MIMALTIAVLVAGSVYLVLQRGLVRIIVGMSLFGHATNLTLLATGVGAWRGEAFPSRTPVSEMSDPLPQAFVLTAIVIAMATTTILLMLSALGKNDDTVDPIDPEDQEDVVEDFMGPSPESTTETEPFTPSVLSTAGRSARVDNSRRDAAEAPATTKEEIS